MTFNKSKYDQQFAKENYDRIPINVKKGEKAKIAEYAKSKGYSSITEYVRDLIKHDMSKHEK